MPSRRVIAFTLVELLVVIAVIAVLIGMLIPAVAGARRSGQRLKSAANLRSLATLLAQYSNEHQEAFLNPFNPHASEKYPGKSAANGPVSFHTVVLPQYEQSGLFIATNLVDPARCTEPFSHVWGSYFANYLEGVDNGKEYFADPMDPVLKNKAAAMRELPIPEDWKVYDTSYWYPPVFWLRSDRYASEEFKAIGTDPVFDAQQLGQNRVGQTTFPSQKVMLFERFDWSGRRGTAGGSDGPAQWNNPKARPYCAFVDGSVSRVRMSEVHALGESADPDTLSVFRPSGFYDPPADYVLAWLLGMTAKDATSTDPYETGGVPFAGTIAWRQYFYATRGGVRGRDVGHR